MARPALLGALALAAAVAALGAGCGTADDAARARATSERFLAAVRARDGASACSQLSDAARRQLESQSGQRCREVVTRLRLAPGAIARVQVAMGSAVVDLASAESLFLSRSGSQWQLDAVGCRASGGKPADQPFDCALAA